MNLRSKRSLPTNASPTNPTERNENAGVVTRAKKTNTNPTENETTPRPNTKPATQRVNPNLSRQPTLGPTETQDSFDALYRDLSHPGAFTRKIAKYLRKNKTHSLHKPRRKKFKRRRIIVYYPYQIIEMDLIEMRNISASNSNYNYILLTIDLFSKKIWLRKMKTKSGPETADAIKSIIADMDYPPQTVIFDEGLEFYNKYVNMLFAQYNIHSYSIKSTTKAGAAERGNRTIKSMIWKYFTDKQTKRWVDKLSDFQSTYNNTYHRVIKRAPNQVTWENRKEVFKVMYPEIHDRIKCRLRVGDRVRVALRKSIFEKGYTQNWSKEIFTIFKVKQRAGVCWYRIKDQAGNLYPKGKYYYDLNLVARA